MKFRNAGGNHIARGFSQFRIGCRVGGAAYESVRGVRFTAVFLIRVGRVFFNGKPMNFNGMACAPYAGIWLFSFAGLWLCGFLFKLLNPLLDEGKRRPRALALLEAHPHVVGFLERPYERRIGVIAPDKRVRLPCRAGGRRPPPARDRTGGVIGIRQVR